MSKKLKKILIIIVILLILLPIVTFATKKIIRMSGISQEDIQKANQKENERALAEKNKFAEEHEDKEGTSIDGLDIESTKVSQNDDSIPKAEDDKSGQVKEILERYYSKETIDKIITEIKNSNSGITDWTTDPMKEPEKELYGMIFDVIENKDLSEDDSQAIKFYINSQMSNIKKDADLKARADKILGISE